MEQKLTFWCNSNPGVFIPVSAIHYSDTVYYKPSYNEELIYYDINGLFGEINSNTIEKSTTFNRNKPILIYDTRLKLKSCINVLVKYVIYHVLHFLV